MNPLEQLKDIHTAEQVAWWPLSWGWWVLAGLIILSLGSLLYLSFRRFQFNKPKRVALLTLAAVDLEDENCINDVNSIMKRVTLAYFAPHNSAALHGEAWATFLVSLVKNEKKKTSMIETITTMQNLRFQPLAPSMDDRVRFKHVATEWLRHADFKAAKVRMETAHV